LNINAGSGVTLTAVAMVNMALYPIDKLSSDSGEAFVRKCRHDFLETGLCILPDFIAPGARTLLAGEANALSGKAYYYQSTHNVYLTEDDPELDEDDVRRRQETTYVGSIAYDYLGETSHLRRLYLWDALKDFIGAVLGKTAFYRFADPLGACSINVFKAGGEHGWHFDESEFAVTLMLQRPLAGGTFEYVPGLRGRDDESEQVERVLNGSRDGVVELSFTVGTLLIFSGSKTIHRVTRVSGDKLRLVPVLCYSERQNEQNSETVRNMFWGRSGTESGIET
jgi:hypothetical protein